MAAIYKGDPVKLDGTTGVIIIAVGTAGSPGLVHGVFAGCEYTDANGKPTYSSYWPGSTAGATNIVFYIYDDPFVNYDVQAAGPLAFTDIGDSADYTYAAGSAYTGVSASYLSTTLAGAATAKQFRIMGISPKIDNASGDAYTVVRVTIAQGTRYTPVNSI
jgi:hypothetical protein